MSEEMNNELEEVIIVTATDDEGNEVFVPVVDRCFFDGFGGVFAGPAGLTGGPVAIQPSA